MNRIEHYWEAEKLAKIAGLPGKTREVMALIELGKLHAMLAACPIEGGHPGDFGVEP